MDAPADPPVQALLLRVAQIRASIVQLDITVHFLSGFFGNQDLARLPPLCLVLVRMHGILGLIHDLRRGFQGVLIEKILPVKLSQIFRADSQYLFQRTMFFFKLRIHQPVVKSVYFPDYIHRICRIFDRQQFIHLLPDALLRHIGAVDSFLQHGDLHAPYHFHTCQLVKIPVQDCFKRFPSERNDSFALRRDLIRHRLIHAHLRQRGERSFLRAQVQLFHQIHTEIILGEKSRKSSLLHRVIQRNIFGVTK